VLIVALSRALVEARHACGGLAMAPRAKRIEVLRLDA
jgi:hypothetical protein